MVFHMRSHVSWNVSPSCLAMKNMLAKKATNAAMTIAPAPVRPPAIVRKTSLITLQRTDAIILMIVQIPFNKNFPNFTNQPPILVTMFMKTCFKLCSQRAVNANLKRNPASEAKAAIMGPKSVRPMMDPAIRSGRVSPNIAFTFSMKVLLGSFQISPIRVHHPAM